MGTSSEDFSVMVLASDLGVDAQPFLVASDGDGENWHECPAYLPDEDFSDLDALQAFRVEGTDNHNNCIFRIVGKHFPVFVSGDCTCSSEDDGGRNKHEALKYKIAAIASILFGGFVGVCIPVLGKKFPALRPENDIFFLIKAFAAGVILSTGFIHILLDAFDQLTSPCLDQNPWGNFPFAGFGGMLSAIGTLMVDFLLLHTSRNPTLIKLNR